MIATDATYKALLLTRNRHYETRVLQGQTVYGLNKIKSLKINRALMNGGTGGLTVGGVSSAICTMTLKENSVNWPWMAEFSVQTRLVSNDYLSASGWITLGTFYTDNRSKTREGDLSITAYDAMLKLDVDDWLDNDTPEPENWPITAYDAVQYIKASTGFQVDARTELDTTAAFVERNEIMTAREVLSAIGAAMGGNWVITAEGKLRLVPLVNLFYDNEAVAGIAIAGRTTVGYSEFGGGTTISAVSGNALAGCAIVGRTESEATRRNTHIGLSLTKFETGTEYKAIDSVTLTSKMGDTYKSSANVQTPNAGTLNFRGARLMAAETPRAANTGFSLTASCEFASQEAADLCLRQVQGYCYRPFEGSGAKLDPAAEPGDLVSIDGKYYQIFNYTQDATALYSAEISAPYDEEVNHEYRSRTRESRVLRSAASTAGSLASAAGAAALSGANAYTDSSLSEFYDAWINVDPAHGTISLGALYEQYLEDRTTLSNHVGIDLDAPAGTINIYADHEQWIDDRTKLKNNVGIDLDSTLATIDIYADHEQWEDDRLTLKNNLGIDLDAVAGTINVFADHEQWEDDRLTLKNHVGIDLDAPAGTINIYATESTVNDLVTRTASLEVSVDGITAEVSKTGVDGLAEGETLYSRIVQNAGSISSEVTRATSTENTLSSRIDQTESSISSLVLKTGVDSLGNNETLLSKITQNADSITSLVYKSGVNELGERETLFSKISQTESDITSLVSKTGVNSLGQSETLYSKITQNADSISSEVTRAQGAEGSLSSRITQNADSISSLITKTGVNSLGNNETLISKITQNAESITSEVTRATGAEGTLSSQISQTADNVSSLITKTGVNSLGENETLISKINQNADGITSLVYKSGVDSLGNNETLYSKISQNADSITSLVSKTGVNSLGQNETLYSKITQNADSITSEVTRAQNAESALSSNITQTASNIRAEVSENYQEKGNYYTKYSAVDITSNGISLSSSGTISLNGATITATGGNFSVNGNGYLTATGAIFSGNTGFGNSILISSAQAAVVVGSGGTISLGGTAISSWDDIVPKFG